MEFLKIDFLSSILIIILKFQPNFTERLQVSLERMAKGKGAEGPNHFFDLQHQTAVALLRIFVKSNLVNILTHHYDPYGSHWL